MSQRDDTWLQARLAANADLRRRNPGLCPQQASEGPSRARRGEGTAQESGREENVTGWGTEGPPPHRYASQLEARYAQQLDWRQAAGEMTQWWYEGITLRLAARCRYTPDFLILFPDMHLEVHETKGFMREAARVRLHVAATRFPMFRFRLVTYTHGQWHWHEIPAERRPYDAPPAPPA